MFKETKEVEELRIKLKDAEAKLAKKEAEFKENPDRALAELFHEKCCRYNHADGCGWYYHSWGGLNTYSEKEKWLRYTTELKNTIKTIKTKDLTVEDCFEKLVEFISKVR